MKVRDLAFETASALSTNKVRTLLTILGIVIGISSVIAMTAIIDGMQASLVNELGLGQSRAVSINLMKNDFSGPNRQDAQRIERGLSSYYDYITIYSSMFLELTSAETDKPASTSIIACEPEFFDAMALKTSQGSFFTDEDDAKAAQLIVIDQVTNKALFGSEEADSVGSAVSFSGNQYTVCAVVQSSGANFGMGSAYIPFNTAAMRMGSAEAMGGTYLIGFAKQDANMDKIAGTTSSYLAAVYDVTDMNAASDEELSAIGTSMEDQTHPGNVSVSTAKQFIDQLNSVMSGFKSIATAVASISLLVGGIGIMNMMLTNVTERIREIGLRKALGAHRSDISSQFLLESITICLIGGALGIVFGYGFAWIGAVIISTVSSAAMGSGSFTPVITPAAVQLASGICIGIGVIFGWYPARRAAKLDPVECLRYQ